MFKKISTILIIFIIYTNDCCINARQVVRHSGESDSVDIDSKKSVNIVGASVGKLSTSLNGQQGDTGETLNLLKSSLLEQNVKNKLNKSNKNKNKNKKNKKPDINKADQATIATNTTDVTNNAKTFQNKKKLKKNLKKMGGGNKMLLKNILGMFGH